MVNLEKYTDILWDFNGTILDDVETGIKSINTLLYRRGLKTLQDTKDYHSVFCFPIWRYYENVGFDLESESFDKIAPEWVEQYMINVVDAKIFDDVIETIEAFRARGFSQTILSATKLDMLCGQLKDLGLDSYFDSEHILGLDNIRAESKVKIAENWRMTHKNSVALMIGDSLHDAEVAAAIEADCVLISRGHQSLDTLKTGGVPILSTLAEIFACS